MVDVETNQEINGRLPSIRAEQATFVLVFFGAVFVALGFVSTSAYYDAMGFPPALFPPESALLGPMGFLYGVPAIFIVAVTPLIGWFGWKVGRTPWFRRMIVDRVKKSKSLQGLTFFIALIAVIVMNTTVNNLLDIPRIAVFLLSAVLIFSSGAVFANTPFGKFGVGSCLMLCFFLYFVFCIVMYATEGIAAYFGRQAVARILAEKEPRFSTVIPLEGESYKPGKLIVCSERFCGFHNGSNPRILSLDGIREIVP